MSRFIWIYLLESYIQMNIWIYSQKEKKSQMNVQIFSIWKNSWIFRWRKIFVNKYLNVFEYPNIQYTMYCSLPFHANSAQGIWPIYLFLPKISFWKKTIKIFLRFLSIDLFLLDLKLIILPKTVKVDVKFEPMQWRNFFLI